jgi:hypothetical protein
MMEKYHTKKGLIEYWAASLFSNNQELFLQCFQPETISKDIFASTQSNKVRVVQDYIDQITRNRTLREVGYRTKNNILGGQKEHEVELVLTYADKKTVTIDAQISEMTDSHHEENHSIYVLDTSVRKMIKMIKQQIE